MDKGLRPDGMAAWLLELQEALQHADDCILSELHLEKDLVLNPNKEQQMFSKFDDQTWCNRAAPSGGYLSQVHKKEHDKTRTHSDHEVKKIMLEPTNHKGRMAESGLRTPTVLHPSPFSPSFCTKLFSCQANVHCH